MKKSEQIEILSLWGHALGALIEANGSSQAGEESPLSILIRHAHAKNAWFTPDNILRSMKAHVKWLEKENLQKWMSKYERSSPIEKQKNIGIIMAGNIPAVGFHDLLSVLASGHKAIIKCSSDDEVLIPFYIEVLKNISAEMASRCSIQPRFTDIDAVIATGNNNSSRYFDYYFGKYPHIIRKNRNSIAIFSGEESENNFIHLGNDLFSYFGLGCRNVSKLYVPKNYNFNFFFEAIERYNELMNHNKYMNNYDYHRALYLLNDESFLTNNFLILREASSIATPVSILHYEYYENESSLQKTLNEQSESIQCIVGKNHLAFGSSQCPGIDDYADGVDTMAFLLSL